VVPTGRLSRKIVVPLGISAKIVPVTVVFMYGTLTDRGLYCRVRVPLESASSDVSDSDHSVFDIETAAVYVAEPSKVGVGPEVGWPEAEGFSQSVTTYLGTNSVRITVEPATDDY